MLHRNAKLTYLSRLDLVNQVEAGWTQSEVARQFLRLRRTVLRSQSMCAGMRRKGIQAFWTAAPGHSTARG